MTAAVTIIGGGLAGTEAAWQIASRGVPVHLYEMRPQRGTEAHVTDRLAEDLGRKGIPVVRTHNISFRFEGSDGAQAEAVSAVMRGPLPIVFVRGRAKANPSLADVMAEYGGT